MSDLRPKRILILEAETEWRERYRTAFSDKGYEVLAAAIGKEAFATIERERPDLVVLDVLMPDMNSLEMMDAIMELEDRILIVVNSDYSHPRGGYLSWCADASVKRSGDPRILLDTIADLLALEGDPIRGKAA